MTRDQRRIQTAFSSGCLRYTVGMTPSATEIATAYHEAGHAVMALALRRPIHRVSIEPNQLRLGHCEVKKGVHGPLKDAVENQILILFGGIGAEARHTGEYAWDAAGEDMRNIRALMQSRPGGPRQVKRYERRLLDKAEYLLDQPGVWTAIERIAAELLRSTTLSGRAARHLYEQAVAQAKKSL
jgi:hypothetical protein